MDKRKIERKIERAQRKLTDLKSREENLSKYGYWDMGYFQGIISALEDLLDDVKGCEQG